MGRTATMDISSLTMATADGRLVQDRLSYGCGAGGLFDKSSVSSVLNSAACIDHADYPLTGFKP